MEPRALAARVNGFRGYKHRRPPPLPPQSNGRVERRFELDETPLCDPLAELLPLSLKTVHDDVGRRRLFQHLRRLNVDWTERYGHRIELVETFVDRSRFAGTCYRAANWRLLGRTAGRTRQDREHRLRVPRKDVYVYALERRFRGRLCR